MYNIGSQIPKIGLLDNENIPKVQGNVEYLQTSGEPKGYSSDRGTNQGKALQSNQKPTHSQKEVVFFSINLTNKYNRKTGEIWQPVMF